MQNDSIYVSRNHAVTGGSPQALYEARWAEGRRHRLIARGSLGIGTFVFGSWRFDWRIGIALALATVLGHAVYFWRRHAAGEQWRRGRRGVSATDRLLRLTLGRDFAVLRDRLLPDGSRIDHLVIGRGGVWLMRSEAWSPDTDIATYGGKLFFGEKSGAALTAEVKDAATAAGRVLSDAWPVPVPVRAVVAVHGGRLATWGSLVCGGVALVRARLLPLWLRRGRHAYTRADVARLARAATRALPPAPHELIRN